MGHMVVFQNERPSGIKRWAKPQRLYKSGCLNKVGMVVGEYTFLTVPVLARPGMARQIAGFVWTRPLPVGVLPGHSGACEDRNSIGL